MFFEEVRCRCCDSSASVLSCFDETSKLEAIRGGEVRDGVRDGVRDAEQTDVDRDEDGLVEDRDEGRDEEQADEASYTLEYDLHLLYKQESIKQKVWCLYPRQRGNTPNWRVACLNLCFVSCCISLMNTFPLLQNKNSE